MEEPIGAGKMAMDSGELQKTDMENKANLEIALDNMCKKLAAQFSDQLAMVPTEQVRPG